MVEIDNPFCKVNQAANIIKNSGLQPGMKVLDLGCGPGRVTIPAARSVGKTGKVLAMDIQKAMLNKVEKKSKDQKLENIYLLNAGVGDGKLLPNNFDRVLLITVLGEIPNQEKAFTEIYATLKLGGRLTVTEIIFDPHFQGRSKVTRLASEAGLKKEGEFGSWYAYTINFVKEK